MSVEVDWASSPLSSARPSLSPTSSAASSPLPSPAHAGLDARSSPAVVASSTVLSSTAVLSAAREREMLLLEESKVRSVQESMVACQQLTDGMLAILEQFDRKLRALDASMQPMHRGTTQLISAHNSPTAHTHTLTHTTEDAARHCARLAHPLAPPWCVVLLL